jgi:hypothetical protein
MSSSGRTGSRRCATTTRSAARPTGNSHGRARFDEHEAQRLGFGRVAYPEWKAVEYLVADWRVPTSS